MFLNILVPTLIIIAISFLGLALNILFKKNGKFPAYQVGHNSDMAKMGIHCVKHEERRSHRSKLKNKLKDCDGCQQLC